MSESSRITVNQSARLLWTTRDTRDVERFRSRFVESDCIRIKKCFEKSVTHFRIDSKESSKSLVATTVSAKLLQVPMGISVQTQLEKAATKVDKAQPGDLRAIKKKEKKPAKEQPQRKGG